MRARAAHRHLYPRRPCVPDAARADRLCGARRAEGRAPRLRQPASHVARGPREYARHGCAPGLQRHRACAHRRVRMVTESPDHQKLPRRDVRGRPYSRGGYAGRGRSRPEPPALAAKLRDHVPFKARISAQKGDPERLGPPLLVSQSHDTNIGELTQLHVFTGGVLVIDSARDDLMLGYLRLLSASPDVGRFADAPASPLLGRKRTLPLLVGSVPST